MIRGNVIHCDSLACPSSIAYEKNLREAGWRTEEHDGPPTAKRRPDRHYCPSCPPVARPPRI